MPRQPCILADWCFRELREPDGEVDVGAWPVDLPAAALDVAAEAVTEGDAAEVESAIEVVFPCDTGTPKAADAAAQLCYDLLCYKLLKREGELAFL